MPTYRVPYRLHGPTQISERHEISSNIILEPGPQNVPSVSGHLEILFDANDRQEAESKAQNEIRTKANAVVSTFAFVLEEGIRLGGYYWVRERSAPNQSKINASLQADSAILDVGSRIYTKIADDVENTKTGRMITWYSFGLDTVTAEDRLVAFWTGIESRIEDQTNRYNYTNAEELAIESAITNILDELNDGNSKKYKWIEGRLGEIKGGVQNETKLEAVERFVAENLEEEHLPGVPDICSLVDDIYYARNKIVHAGQEIDNVQALVDKAENILREMILNDLPSAYSDFLPGDPPLRCSITPPVSPESWLPIVFEHDKSLVLSESEIMVRVIAATRSLNSVSGLHIGNFAGPNQPMVQVSGGYKLNPSRF